jgi:hypothetical protein
MVITNKIRKPKKIIFAASADICAMPAKPNKLAINETTSKEMTNLSIKISLMGKPCYKKHNLS